jgi:Berberine and berberine like
MARSVEHEERTDRVRASSGDHFERLVQAKNQYSSTNLFRANNIAPTL